LCFFFYGNRIMPDDLKARLKTFVPPPAETKVQSFEQLPTVYDPPFEQWNSKKKKQEHGALIVQSDSSVLLEVSAQHADDRVPTLQWGNRV
jgi:hypothetical protein